MAIKWGNKKPAAFFNAGKQSLVNAAFNCLRGMANESNKERVF
jgi:hypothetical protein